MMTIVKLLVLSLVLPIAAATKAAALPPIEVLPLPRLIEVNSEWVHKGPRYTSLWAFGTSMLPYARNGDTFLVERRGFNSPIYVGDLVTYQLPNGQLVSHEVVKVDRGFLLIKGLNNTVADGWMPASKVIYLVRRVLRVTR